MRHGFATSHARVDVLGVGVSAISMAQAVDTIARWVAHGARQYVCVTGVHGIMESLDDPQVRAIHNGAGMVTPDGMPLVWLCRARGHERVERVYGPDLLLACAAHAAEQGWRFFFYGGQEGVPELLARRLKESWPRLTVVGTYSPPFRPLTIDEDEELVQQINRTRPDVVWVGLSTPKQERWMAAHVERLTAPVLIGVGAAFDFHAGLKAQAPRWMQRSGLEWSFRLLCEPRRLGRRYVVNNPRFLWHLVRAVSRARRSTPPR